MNLKILSSCQQTPGSRGKDVEIGADRFPVHEPVAPECARTEAAEQNTRFERPFTDKVDGGGDLRVVETAGFAVGGGKVARPDADAVKSFQLQNRIDIAHRFPVLDLDENERFAA